MEITELTVETDEGIYRASGEKLKALKERVDFNIILAWCKKPE